MQYFAQFPTITTTDYQGNQISVIDILKRVEVIPSLLKNPLLFYSYDIQDGDTPDIIANKYYGDSYRYWMVPYANQMIDSQAEWPMNSNLFNNYLLNKYSAIAANTYPANTASTTFGQVLTYTQSTIQSYIITISTYDSLSSTTTATNYNVDANTYTNTMVTSGTPTYFANSSVYVTKSVSKSVQTVYDYEVALNESKRNINLFNASYAGSIERQLTTLLRK